MYIRSKDGTRITQMNSAALQDNDLIVNGELFDRFGSAEEAAEAMRRISQELNAFETFLDLSGEFEDDFDDDDEDWDDDDEWDDDDDDSDDDDDEVDFLGSGIVFTDKDGNPFKPFK